MPISYEKPPSFISQYAAVNCGIIWGEQSCDIRIRKNLRCILDAYITATMCV